MRRCLLLTPCDLSSLHKKWNFPLRISSVNATKLAETADLVTFTEEIGNGKLQFFVRCLLLFSYTIFIFLQFDIGIDKCEIITRKPVQSGLIFTNWSRRINIFRIIVSKALLSSTICLMTVTKTKLTVKKSERLNVLVLSNFCISPWKSRWFLSISPSNINSPFIRLTFLHNTILKFKKFHDMQENHLDNLYPYLSETKLFLCKHY